MKVELVNQRVESLEKRVEQTQQETIEILSELINTGYNLHERRIKKIEDHLNFPPAQ